MNIYLGAEPLFKTAAQVIMRWYHYPWMLKNNYVDKQGSNFRQFFKIPKQEPNKEKIRLVFCLVFILHPVSCFHLQALHLFLLLWICWSVPRCFINQTLRMPVHIILCSNHYVFLGLWMFIHFSSELHQMYTDKCELCNCFGSECLLCEYIADLAFLFCRDNYGINMCLRIKRGIDLTITLACKMRFRERARIILRLHPVPCVCAR